jgi:hypothetical protein
VRRRRPRSGRPSRNSATFPVEGAEPEPGFEKVALYADAAGIPTHAARQLSGGKWTSKLGRREDIEHALDDLTGDVYGSVVAFLKGPPQGPGPPAQQHPA